MSSVVPLADAVVAGLGIDIAEVGRFERLLARHPYRVWSHWFTTAETLLCSAALHPAESTAMRFAVKEATLKAIGQTFGGPVRWRDIEVLGDPLRLEVRLHGEIAALAQTARIKGFRVSAGHGGHWVIATVVAETPRTEPEENG